MNANIDKAKLEQLLQAALDAREAYEDAVEEVEEHTGLQILGGYEHMIDWTVENILDYGANESGAITEVAE